MTGGKAKQTFSVFNFAIACNLSNSQLSTHNYQLETDNSQLATHTLVYSKVRFCLPGAKIHDFLVIALFRPVASNSQKHFLPVATSTVAPFGLLPLYVYHLHFLKHTVGLLTLPMYFSMPPIAFPFRQRQEAAEAKR